MLKFFAIHLFVGTYKLKLPLTSQSRCTPVSIQPPNATVQSADQVFLFGQPPNEAVQSPVEVDVSVLSNMLNMLF